MQPKYGERSFQQREDDEQSTYSYKKGGMGEKTFLTQTKIDESPSYSLHDFLFPAGKVAKLAKIYDDKTAATKLRDVVQKFGFYEPTPVIYMAGAKDSGRAKFYAGICRAAFRVDAVVLDSGIKSGIEQFALRRKIKLAGVFPEMDTKLPKINPTEREWNELSNGHTHLFMLCNDNYRWGDEAEFKMAVANTIAKGVSKSGVPKCKIVTVVMGDLESCTQDIILSIENNLPVILVPGAPYADSIIRHVRKLQGQEESEEEESGNGRIKISPELEAALESENAHIYIMEDNNSEDIAALLHFFLTVTPY